MREELVGERALAPDVGARLVAGRERGAHLGDEIDRLHDRVGQRLRQLGIRLLAQLRRGGHARALEPLPEALEPVGDAERVAAQLLEILPLGISQRPLFGRALQAREDLQVLPHAVAGEQRRRDLDRELHVVAPLARRRDLHRRRPLDARQVVHAEPQAHVFGAARRLGLGGLS